MFRLNEAGLAEPTPREAVTTGGQRVCAEVIPRLLGTSATSVRPYRFRLVVDRDCGGMPRRVPLVIS